METFLTYVAIISGMIVGYDGARLVIKEKTKGISNSEATFGWFGTFLLLMISCSVTAYCQSKIYERIDFFSLLALTTIEIYSIISGGVLLCIIVVIKNLFNGFKTYWPEIICGISLIIIPQYFWLNGPHLINRFDSFSLYVYWGFGISLIIYFVCKIIFLIIRKLA